MDDTISRAAAIDALADYIHNVDKVLGTGRLTAYDCKDAATSVFEELPSARPEIIRCKDCKHYTKPNIEYCELYGAMILWGEDDFCSRGERRTDGR